MTEKVYSKIRKKKKMNGTQITRIKTVNDSTFELNNKQEIKKKRK